MDEAVGHVADVKTGAAPLPAGPQPLARQQLVQVVGGGAAGVDQGHRRAHVFADHPGQQGVVGAAQDQGVHAGLPHLLQVLGDDQPGHLLAVGGGAVHIAVLHQGDEQGAGPGGDLGPGHQAPEDLLVAVGADGGGGADHPDPAVAGGPGGPPRRGGDHTHIRYGQFGGLLGGVGAGHRAAGRHDALDVLGQQESDVLPGVLQNDLPAAAAVRHPAGVPEIDDVLAGQQPPQFPDAGQPAQPAVEHADGAVIHGGPPAFPSPGRSGGR